MEEVSPVGVPGAPVVPGTGVVEPGVLGTVGSRPWPEAPALVAEVRFKEPPASIDEARRFKSSPVIF